ncbi:alpha/beta fold hydrolase [Streptomyces sp. I6]|nr:alpha/beta fold hydrolase [Streptomyces sp. I6]
MVLLPGLAATSRVFDGTVRDLSRDHRVITLELPGHGDRTDPADDTPATVSGAAGALHTLLDRLGVTEATLLGWSLGATVAYAYLERFGRKHVRALVSVDQSPRLVLDRDWPHAAFGALDEDGARDLARGVTADFAAFTANLVGGSFAAGTEPAAEPHGLLVSEALRCDPVAVRSLLADVTGQDWRERLPLVTSSLPTLFLHGARSRVYPTALGRWLGDTLPSARLEVFDSSGHLPFLEEPERFLRTVRAFTAHDKEPTP